MRLTRLYCGICREETIHASFSCIHCGTPFPLSSLVPRLADYMDHMNSCRAKGGKASKMRPRKGKVAL